MQRPKEFFYFTIPISKTSVKNGSVLSRKVGEVVVSVDSDEEIISLMYGGVDILPVMETIHGATDHFYDAVSNHLSNMEGAIDLENEAI